jgi:ion channel POLLUX/CASTOR
VKPGLRQRFRYRFDNLMARGAVAQVLMLALLSLFLVVVIGLVVAIVANQAGWSIGWSMWQTFMRTLDAGTMGADEGSPVFLVFMLLATLGGIFVISAFIGVLNGALEHQLEDLRKGRSLVVEDRHTVILGYTPKIHTLLHELAIANANQPGACVAILAQKDKVEMDDEIREHLGKPRMRVVTRSGNPMSPADLVIANPGAAKSVIIMSPEVDEDGEALHPHESDTFVLKTLLALGKVTRDAGETRYHVVAELQDERILAVARLVAGEQAALLLTPPLISRLMVQTGRQSGLSAVFTELLDFGGSEIYLQPQAELEGRTFREALAAYDDSTLMGVLGADDVLHLPPRFDRVFQKGDRVVAISEDDDTVRLNGKPGRGPTTAIVAPQPAPPNRAERTLILGTSDRLALVLRELAPHCAPGSLTMVVGEDETLGSSAVAEAHAAHPHLGATFRAGDISDRKLLDSLDVTGFHHVLCLSEAGGRSVEVADARTMVTLLHLRDIARRSGKQVPVTTEILDLDNRELAAAAEADDFIVSNTLIALLVAQLAENRHLVRVFDELFAYGGHDLRIFPAHLYVQPDTDVDFYTVVEAAAQRGEVAIGWRRASEGRDPARSFGVRVNPTKSTPVRFTADDQIVVMTQVD